MRRWQTVGQHPEVFLRLLFELLHEQILAGYPGFPSEYSYVQGRHTLTFAKLDHPVWGEVLVRQDNVEAPLDYGCTASVVLVLPARDGACPP
jgi:hypothetical protein